MSDAEYFERTTTFEVTFPATRGTDLTDPITRRSLSPEWVRLELTRKYRPADGAGPSAGEWAHVAVYGPRRLKSGDLGHEISSFGWQSVYNLGLQPGMSVERPEWLAAALAEQMPEGWSRFLVELPDGAEQLVDAHAVETTRANAALIEDAACDADFTESGDYCNGLRAAAALLLKTTEEATPTGATATPFFQPGHTYTREHHASTIRFLVKYVNDSPCGTYRVAFGWCIEDGDVTWSPFDSDDLTGWTDTTTGDNT